MDCLYFENTNNTPMLGLEIQLYIQSYSTKFPIIATVVVVFLINQYNEDDFIFQF